MIRGAIATRDAPLGSQGPRKSHRKRTLDVPRLCAPVTSLGLSSLSITSHEAIKYSLRKGRVFSRDRRH